MELNGKLDAIPEPYRSMAAYLDALPAAERLAAWLSMLAASSDREELEKAVENERPEGPPPEDDGDSLDEWEPIRLGTLSPVEAFPLDVLPFPARDLATAAAESIGCPIDFPAVAILAAASGLIGRSARLLVKDGYFESASLYVALVGIPSSGKTPGLDAALAPVWSIALDLHREWQAAMSARGADDQGEEPTLRRIVTTDPTTEALGPILCKNPRGLIVAPDEFTKWVMSMDQYKGGKGGDRPFYLSTWSGKPWYIDRAKHMREPIVVPHPFLTVVGGLTPAMLTELPEGKGRDDGFIARLLFTYPDWRIPPYSDRGIPEEVAAGWDHVARAHWNRDITEKDGNLYPRVVRMTRDATAEWTRWVNKHRREQRADGFEDSLQGPWGKLEAYAARLALVLHLLHLASDPTRSPPADPPDLHPRIIEAASILIAYFKSHARRVYASIDGKMIDGGGNVRALIRWILRNDLAGFSTRDIGMNFDRFRDDPAALNDALEWMTSHNLIRPRPGPEAATSGKPGRKRAPSFDVNPDLRTAPRFQQFQRNPGCRPDSVGNGGNVALPLERNGGIRP
jgi:hypothetical protein